MSKAAGLGGLRFHDLRHHAITELAESQTSDETIMAIAGHVSRKMLERYSHIRMTAKRNAVAALSSSKPNVATNLATKQVRERKQDAQVFENMVDLSGIEPLASSLRTRRSPS